MFLYEYNNLPFPTSAMSSVSYFSFLPSMVRQVFSMQIGCWLPLLKLPDATIEDRNVIVTGANSGIGLQLSLELARRGANVVLACRSESRGQEAVHTILKAVPGAEKRVRCMILDTDSLESVRAFVKAWKSAHPHQHLDILAHNAGIASSPAGQDFSPEGHDIMYSTNFLGSFLLTNLMQDSLSPDARVLLTSSFAQNRSNFSPDFSMKSTPNQIDAGFHFVSKTNSSYSNSTEAREKNGIGRSSWYANTKAMQYIFGHLLQLQFDRQASDGSTKRTAHTWAPGLTFTTLLNKFEDTPDSMYWIVKKMSYATTAIEEGVKTAVYLCVSDDPEVMKKGGEYWDFRISKEVPATALMSQKQMDRFWKRWENDAGIEW